MTSADAFFAALDMNARELDRKRVELVILEQSLNMMKEIASTRIEIADMRIEIAGMTHLLQQLPKGAWEGNKTLPATVP